MRLKILLGTAIATIAMMEGYALQPSQAIQLQDGTVYFAQPPRLIKAVTTYNDVYVWGATYYFTVSLPENAGEPLQRITINQREGADYVRFDLKDSFAFEGNRSRKGQKLGLKDATSDRKTQTLSLTFDPAISPGKTITIGLKPLQNPTIAGVYLFGVTAFPPGEKSHGQFLGFGRLHFYSRGFGFSSPWLFRDFWR
ncbi:DUF2808 domain-containing protein [Dendronalium sp. ChiSLP03b]|uniref:DUF2808 domain-containing protein n=1 Tax=Dendronalium sp. ChiSLP03b TaxID=3075381 RepID=UPI002AD50B64|nr:DUF2808 domain-containing protein [Dendronalium sp. ChiSLP03b]MDZ8205825.1 DUF2808 domain-containing protein [Dendronalium sp. ChiSLP03b]